MTDTSQAVKAALEASFSFDPVQHHDGYVTVEQQVDELIEMVTRAGLVLLVRPPVDDNEWDLGSSEPEGVGAVIDGYSTDEDDDNHRWGKTVKGDYWKGYKNGGKVYLTWDELVRRWGPVTLP